MCLVSICPKGTEKNTEKVTKFIKSGMSSNTQGSGYMFKRDNTTTITISKGYFNINDLLKDLEKENLKIEDELVIHHRISTAGKVSPENSHPFVLSKKHDECCATNISINKPCIAHNGCFSKLNYYQDLDRDFSDTYAFARYILSNKFLLDLLDKDEFLFNTLTEHIVGYSKIAILYPDKDVKTIGTFIKDEGYLHSNNGYITHTYDRGGSSFYRNYGWDGYGYDEIDYTNYDSEEIYEERRKEKLRKVREQKLIDQAIESKNTTNTTNSTIGKLLPLSISTRFDSTTMEITKFNFHHFNFISKLDYKRGLIIGKLELKTLVNFDSESLFQSLRITTKESEVKEIFTDQAVTMDSIRENYYYIPKKEYLRSYSEFSELAMEVKDIGKQTLKKLEKLLSYNYHKKNDDEIIYKKTNKRYTKRALTIYKDLVSKEVQFINSKNNSALNEVVKLLN